MNKKCINPECSRVVDNPALKGDTCSLKCAAKVRFTRRVAEVAQAATRPSGDVAEKVTKPAVRAVEKG